MGRYIRYWYTYRNVVAVLIGLGASLATYGLYTQQVACDTHGSCAINISVHPEDRLVSESKLDPPSPKVLIVGIDNQSVQSVGEYPLPRSLYAEALQVLEKDGAAVSPFNWADVTVYNAIVDRYVNGDTSNDHSYGRKNDGQKLDREAGDDAPKVDRQTKSHHADSVSEESSYVGGALPQPRRIEDREGKNAR